MSGEARRVPPAPAFTLGGTIRDWYSGAVLDDYTGLVVSTSSDGIHVLMRTWFDRTTGERAWAGVRVLGDSAWG
jgi:hypothetical protein